jgi:hypothetical protein
VRSVKIEHWLLRVNFAAHGYGLRKVQFATCIHISVDVSRCRLERPSENQSDWLGSSNVHAECVESCLASDREGPLAIGCPVEFVENEYVEISWVSHASDTQRDIPECPRIVWSKSDCFQRACVTVGRDTTDAIRRYKAAEIGENIGGVYRFREGDGYGRTVLNSLAAVERLLAEEQLREVAS